MSKKLMVELLEKVDNVSTEVKTWAEKKIAEYDAQDVPVTEADTTTPVSAPATPATAE